MRIWKVCGSNYRKFWMIWDTRRRELSIRERRTLCRLRSELPWQPPIWGRDRENLYLNRDRRYSFGARLYETPSASWAKNEGFCARYLSREICPKTPISQATIVATTSTRTFQLLGRNPIAPYYSFRDRKGETHVSEGIMDASLT